MRQWNNEGNNVYTKNRIRIKEIIVKERIQSEDTTKIKKMKKIRQNKLKWKEENKDTLIESRSIKWK